jgi:hypothetical protein
VSGLLGRCWLALAAAALPLGLAAQGDVAGRLSGRVPPDVARAVQDVAAGLTARGLPADPLVDKAIEGAAKRVPAERVIAAVRALAGRLDQAARALRAGGIAAPRADAVEGGADALNAGLGPDQVRDLAKLSQPPYDAALTLRVAAELAGLGVGPQETLDLLRDVIKTGGTPSDLLNLPAEVASGVARGQTPVQAAHGVGRGNVGTPPPSRPAHPSSGPGNPHKP